MIGRTPGETGAEAETARLLRQASDGYGDLPEPVAHRLDRVLDSLPAADTLRSAPAPARQGLLASLAERLRPKRVRYALASGAAAVLITAGAVAVGLQSLATQGDDAGSSQVYAEDAPRSDEDGADAGAPGSSSDSLNEESEATGAVEDEVAIADVASFASGFNYTDSTDMLTAMHGLGTATLTGEVPDELAVLAAGGEFWHACEDAIAAEYQRLLVAVDFARYEDAPAIMALLVSDQGEIAVALSPACADGVIEVLAIQP
ncbi:hypothetical protein GCM10009830_04450 [Glycomyces endophyticus]|uniref:Uncharacterized protein n=1 Tax=Glycomyces endophyticus TaxID=480996 RepID=A0ABN2FYX0_9ACTN